MPNSYLTNLAGLSFRPKESKTVVLQLRPGDQLDLEREPMNAYDENAIKVFALVKPGTLEIEHEDPAEAERHFIGYVEKIANPLIARDLDAGLTFSAWVEKSYPDDGTSARQGMWAKPLISIKTLPRT